MHDFVVIYSRSLDLVKVNFWERTEEQLAAYKNPDNDSRGEWRAQDLSASKPYSAGQFGIEGPTGLRFEPPPNRYWRCNKEQFERWVADKRIWWGVNKDARPMLKAFLSEVERGITPHTWWDYDFAGHNKEATLELKELFGGDAPFDTPKPVKLMRRLLELFCPVDALVLDFFAGSAPFGHAAMEMAAINGSAIRHCSVQFPEPVERKDYPTIAEIAKERLRRAGKKIREENPLFQGDLSFRVFKLASSNIREWDPDRENLAATLMEHTAHLRTDRTDADILFEVLLKLGLDLTVPIEEKKIAGKTVHSIGAGTLMVCLAEKITAKEVEPLALGIAEWHKTQNPSGDSTVVFRDSAFADDVAKTNITAILHQHGLENVRSL
jgi:adenine-specific DNA-methyltransferase